MKKTLRIELDYNWVLTRIDDAKYPVEVLKDRFVKGKIEKINESYLHLTLAVDENDYEKTKNKISTFFAQKYGKSNLSALSFSDCEPNTDVENDESKTKIPTKATIRKIRTQLTTRSSLSTRLSARKNSKAL